jgi:hypothetical protein
VNGSKKGDTSVVFLVGPLLSLGILPKITSKKIGKPYIGKLISAIWMDYENSGWHLYINMNNELAIMALRGLFIVCFWIIRILCLDPVPI